jgi:hypothetical protein
VPPRRAIQTHQPQEIGDQQLSSNPVAAQEWPPQLATRVGCQLLQQRGAKTAMQTVSGDHPTNQAVRRIIQGDKRFLVLFQTSISTITVAFFPDTTYTSHLLFLGLLHYFII